MAQVFVTITDDEGFNTNIIGPFPNFKKADKWISDKNEDYDGCCQEPYQAFNPMTPEAYKKWIGDD